MAETHRSHWSTLRVALSGALLLGALTVLGVAALPQQSAHAAPKPKAPKADVVCSGSTAIECNNWIVWGNTVKVTLTTDHGDCIFTMTAGKSVQISDPHRDYGRASGVVTSADGKAKPGSPDPCEMLGIGKYASVTFDYDYKPKKGGGKKK